jgi:hypothetical protein
MTATPTFGQLLQKSNIPSIFLSSTCPVKVLVLRVIKMYYWELYLEKSPPPGRRKEQLLLFIRKTYKKSEDEKGKSLTKNIDGRTRER